MTSDLEVDTDGLRACATALVGTAADVRTGLDRSPPSVPRAPGWATADAAGALLAAAARELAEIGDAIAATGRHVSAAATEYEAADVRAATRLRATARLSAG